MTDRADFATSITTAARTMRQARSLPRKDSARNSPSGSSWTTRHGGRAQPVLHGCRRDRRRVAVPGRAVRTHAAIALGNARNHEELSQALTSRQVIGQATGILMERYGIDEDAAFAFLVRASSTSNTKLRSIAQEMVDRRATT